jgi:polysaccharide biosynthesis/export protein
MNFYNNLLARIAFALVVTAGPVALSQTPDAAAPASAPAAPATPAVLPALPESKVDSTYIIGPGDTLQIFVWRQPELSVSVPVRPDGKVSTPLVEDIIAVGKTPSQLAREMEKVLSEYVRSPQVNVIVSQPVSTYSQVKIIGQVSKPQALPFREGITALDAVLAVGGLAPFAAGNRAKVVRTEKGKQREIKIRLDDIINKGDMKQNILLQPGDVLVVPESRF